MMSMRLSPPAHQHFEPAAWQLDAAVAVVPEMPPEVKALLEKLRHAKQMLEQAQRDAAGVVHAAAVTLTREDGLSMRDAGRIMGISHQRVAQILEENEHLGQELGNFGGGDFGGVSLPEGGPMGRHGAYEAAIKT